MEHPVQDGPRTHRQASSPNRPLLHRQLRLTVLDTIPRNDTDSILIMGRVNHHAIKPRDSLHLSLGRLRPRASHRPTRQHWRVLSYMTAQRSLRPRRLARQDRCHARWICWTCTKVDIYNLNFMLAYFFKDMKFKLQYSYTCNGDRLQAWRHMGNWYVNTEGATARSDSRR